MALVDNKTKIQALLDGINALPDASSLAPELQEKTVTPTTTTQSVMPDSGYDGLSKVTVNAMPTATQATPSISVTSSGLITASATQTAGYVAAGTKTMTQQLTTQAAQTITPGTSNKTIASGRYLTGTQTIRGDANLVPENIAAGVSIFDVIGALEIPEGGGLPSGISALVTGTYTATSDITSEFYFDHNLGVEPNFFVWFLVDDSPVRPTSSSAFFGATLREGTNIVRNVNGLSATGSFAGTQFRTTINNFLTSNTAAWACNSVYKINSGSIYRWACGVLDDVR